MASVDFPNEFYIGRKVNPNDGETTKDAQTYDPDDLPQDFKPWINADNARRDGVTVEQAAKDTAALWKNGLKGWGIESDRIQRLKESVDRAVYTPGSTAGKPISILASLKAPEADWQSNQEVLLEQIEGTVTFPKKKRTALAMKLNSIIAAPSFKPWITGEPLDIQSLLYTPDGKPRHSIFYIAHLSETERMFIVTLLYSAIETWMRCCAC